MTRWVKERTDQELLDDLLAVYDANKRDKDLPIKVSMPKKAISKFAVEFPGSNGKIWLYRGWLLKNVVG